VRHQLTKQLLRIQGGELPRNAATIKLIQGEIDGILEREDVKWKQRAKQNWYRDGDRNTQYFHSWANHRRKINGIHQIAVEEGRLWSSRQEVGEAFATYFDKLFTTQAPSRIQVSLQHMEARVTPEMNSQLLLPFVDEEVRIDLIRCIL
jgi:hypothetical protein